MYQPKYSVLLYGLILAIMLSAVSSGQSLSELYNLYEHRDLNQLYEKTNELYQKYPENIEVRFFKTLFIQDADEAFKIYLELYGNSQGRLKAMIAAKIAEYYYAKGFYVKASEYSQAAKEGNVASQQAKERTTVGLAQTDAGDASDLVIQVGAFKFKENAQYLQNVLKSHQVLSRIIPRQTDGKTLYCVWIDGKSNFEDTREFAEYINQKFNLKYRIFKP